MAKEKPNEDALSINSETWRKIYLGFLSNIEQLQHAPRNKSYALEIQAMQDHLYMVAMALNNIALDMKDFTGKESLRIAEQRRTSPSHNRPISIAPLTGEEIQIAEQDAKKTALVKMYKWVDEAMLSIGQGVPPRPPIGFEEHFYPLVQKIHEALTLMQSRSREMFEIFFERTPAPIPKTVSSHKAAPKKDPSSEKTPWWKQLFKAGFSGSYMKKKESPVPDEDEARVMAETQEIISNLESSLRSPYRRKESPRAPDTSTANLDNLLFSYLFEADTEFPPQGYQFAEDSNRDGGRHANTIHENYFDTLLTLRRRLIAILDRFGIDISYFQQVDLHQKLK